MENEMEEKDVARIRTGEAASERPVHAENATSGVPSTFRMWAMHCPFRKTGSPVLGTFGAREEAVVILTLATWKALCVAVPQLQTTQFEVGRYE